MEEAAEDTLVSDAEPEADPLALAEPEAEADPATVERSAGREMETP